MKVLVIGDSFSAEDRRAWSGTVYQAIKGLERAGFEVDYLSANRDYKQTFWNKVVCTYWLKVPSIFGKQIRMDESLYNVWRYKQTLDNYDYSPYDVVFVPTYISAVFALPKNIKAKIVHLTDATIDSLFGYYTEFSNLWFHNYWEAHYIGKNAFLRSDLIIASSDWCKVNAIKDFGCDPEKIAVVEFGANIDMTDIPAQEKELDGKEHLNIYWSGVNWNRKGGDIAFACCEELIHQGYDVTFNITGMKQLPDEVKKKSFVRDYGFLNKNNPEEYKLLISIMRSQDLFLFPSKAECSSIALCEANGFGLPCFVFDTGGIANYVVNGKNGYMLPLSADGKSFAHRIILSINNKELNKLSAGAVRHFKEHLNWNTWSLMVGDLIKVLMGKNG